MLLRCLANQIVRSRQKIHAVQEVLEAQVGAKGYDAEATIGGGLGLGSWLGPTRVKPVP